MGAEESKIAEDPHNTNLQYKQTSSVHSANRVFGECYNGNTVIILNPGRGSLLPYIIVPEGTYALVQNQGRDLDYRAPDGSTSAVWPPGIHRASIFTKVAHLVTKQFIVFETPIKGCKTADNVTVGIDICLVLRIMGNSAKGEDPALVRRFVYELGTNGLEVQLRAAQDEALRTLARSVNHTEVYKLRSGTLRENFNTGSLDFRTRPVDAETIQDEMTPPAVKDESETEAPVGTKELHKSTTSSQAPSSMYAVIEDIKRNLNRQFNPYGVEITNVAITDVKLPETFQTQMQNRTAHSSAIKEQNQKQLSDMQMLQYKEELDTTKLQRQMMIMETEQTGKAKCAENQKEIDLILSDTALVMKQIEQTTKVRCNNVGVEAELKIAQIRADREKIASEIGAHCDAEIEMLTAEREALELQLNATVDEISASGKAKAAEIIARAEGVAAKKLEKCRAHKLRMKRLEMLAALARNNQTAVSGDASNNLLAELLIANRQQSVMVNLDGYGRRP